MLLALKMEEGAMSWEAEEFRWYLEAGKDGKWILPWSLHKDILQTPWFKPSETHFWPLEFKMINLYCVKTQICGDLLQQEQETKTVAPYFWNARWTETACGPSRIPTEEGRKLTLPECFTVYQVLQKCLVCCHPLILTVTPRGNFYFLHFFRLGNWGQRD